MKSYIQIVWAQLSELVVPLTDFQLVQPNYLKVLNGTDENYVQKGSTSSKPRLIPTCTGIL